MICIFILSSKCHCLLWCNLSHILQIFFISNHINNYIFGKLLNLLYPSFNIFKCLGLSNIKNNYRTNSIFIICFSNSSKSLLSSCIPNLAFNFFLIYIISFSWKLNSNCRFVLFNKLFSYKLTNNITLANLCISNHYNLKQMIYLFLHYEDMYNYIKFNRTKTTYIFY